MTMVVVAKQAALLKHGVCSGCTAPVWSLFPHSETIRRERSLPKPLHAGKLSQQGASTC